MSEWVIEVLDSMGYLGVALLMLIENIFPPIPSEIVMPLAGFTASRGEMTLWGAVLSGAAGSLGGATAWYAAAHLIPEERVRAFVDRHGRFLFLKGQDIDRAAAWFRRHGPAAVLVGRCVPGVRTLISIPAGFSRMPFGSFLLYSALGTVAWTAALGVAGYLLGEHYRRVSDKVEMAGWIVLGALAAALAVWIYRRRRNA